MGEISRAYITDHFLSFATRVFLSQNQKIHQWGVGTMRLAGKSYADETPTVGRITFPGFFRQHNKLRGNPEKRETFFNIRHSIDMSFQVVTTLEGNIYSSDVQKRSSWFSEKVIISRTELKWLSVPRRGTWSKSLVSTAGLLDLEF